MLFKFNMTEKDYIKAFQSHLKKQQKTLRGNTAIATVFKFSVLLGLVILIIQPNEPPPVIYLVGAGYLLLLISEVSIYSKFRIKRLLNRAVRRKVLPEGYFGPQTLEVKDDRILIYYGESKAERFYAGIEKIEDYHDSTLIFANTAFFDIIPSSAFQNTNERLNFINLLKTRMALAKDVPAGNENLAEERAKALMAFDFSWEEQRYIDALITGNRVFSKTKLFWQKGRVVMLLLGIWFVVAAIPNNDLVSIRLAVLFIGCTILFLNVLYIHTPLLRRKIKRQVQSGGVSRDAIGRHTICVYENKLKLFSRLSSQDMSFDQLYGIKLLDDFVILLGKANTITALPASAFKPPESLDGFVEILSAKVKLL